MFGSRRLALDRRIRSLRRVLSQRPVRSLNELSRRCQAADELARFGPSAIAALPNLLQTLIVQVDLDCVLTLRLDAAIAIWRICGRLDSSGPFIAEAIKDEYWGLAPKAITIAGETRSAVFVPELIWMAERRRVKGPFHFEGIAPDSAQSEEPPLLAMLANAIGQCAPGRWNGSAYLNEAQLILASLRLEQDNRVWLAAEEALARLPRTSEALSQAKPAPPLTAHKQTPEGR